MRTFIIDGWQLLAYFVAFLSPIVVGLVTKRSTSPAIKAVLLALINCLTTVGAQVLDAHDRNLPVLFSVIVFNALVTFTVAVASHFGLWKPTGVAGAAQDTGISDRA